MLHDWGTSWVAMRHKPRYGAKPATGCRCHDCHSARRDIYKHPIFNTSPNEHKPKRTRDYGSCLQCVKIRLLCSPCAVVSNPSRKLGKSIRIPDRNHGEWKIQNQQQRSPARFEDGTAAFDSFQLPSSFNNRTWNIMQRATNATMASSWTPIPSMYICSALFLTCGAAMDVAMLPSTS